MKYFGLMLIFLAFMGCDSKEEKLKQTSPDGEFLTKEMQEKLTPQEVIFRLKAGNDRFVREDTLTRNHSEQVRKAALGQYPKAIVLSCVDSRVPVEDVFDLGIGDIFVARVAGNFVNEDILGSMEFATKVAGAKAVVVLGHEHCGAIKAAIDEVELGHISSLVENIEPAVKMTRPAEGADSSNQELVHDVCINNIKLTMQRIRSESPILKQMEEDGDIAIAGAFYNMDTGQVDFMEEK